MLSQHSTAYIQMEQQYFPSCTEVCRCIFTVFVLLVYQVLDLYKGPMLTVTSITFQTQNVCTS